MPKAKCPKSNVGRNRTRHPRHDADGAYYGGILIRFYGLPGPGPLPLKRQLLLGFPVSIAVITPLLAVLGAALSKTETNPASL